MRVKFYIPKETYVTCIYTQTYFIQLYIVSIATPLPCLSHGHNKAMHKLIVTKLMSDYINLHNTIMLVC